MPCLERRPSPGMNTEPKADRWYALQLRSRWESSTAALLSCKGYQTFLPTYKNATRGSSRSKEVQSPLFPGYLFCRFNVCDRLPVLITPGVISVVGTGRVPIPVEESEIESIQRMVSSGLRVEPCPYLEVGQLVRIEDGALSGIEGVLTSFKGSQRIVVSISLLRRSVALEIDRSVVSPGQPKRSGVAQPGVVVPWFEPAVT
ncbi:MAG: NusG-like protein [Acidobacteria bacterium]|nr:MAG: NusG-like protein [Acidobacteriota bacterium]